jgi:hypothetical protein
MYIYDSITAFALPIVKPTGSLHVARVWTNDRLRSRSLCFVNVF